MLVTNILIFLNRKIFWWMLLHKDSVNWLESCPISPRFKFVYKRSLETRYKIHTTCWILSTQIFFLIKVALPAKISKVHSSSQCCGKDGWMGDFSPSGWQVSKFFYFISQDLLICHSLFSNSDTTLITSDCDDDEKWSKTFGTSSSWCFWQYSN